MKKVFSSSLLCIIVLSNVLFAQTNWKFINDNPNLPVNSSYLRNNTAYFWSSGVVFITSDGGESFNVQTPYTKVGEMSAGCCYNHGVAFADSLIGYVAHQSTGEFRTEDGGKSWQQTGHSGSNISHVEFGSETIGWKMGGGGFYRTPDAGMTWGYIFIPSLLSGGILSNVFALDEHKIWLLKSYHSGRTVEGSIWRSRNSGFYWEQLETGIISSDSNQVVYHDIVVRNSGHGIAVGNIFIPLTDERKAIIQRTTDFGNNWTTRELPEYKLKNIQSVDDSTWIILGNSKYYYNLSENDIIQIKSTDHGQTWMEPLLIIDTNNYLYSSEYIPKYNSIIVSTVRGMYKSTDKGVSYSPVITRLDVYVRDVNLDRKPKTPNRQMIFAHSFNREYLLSTDAGDSWEKKEIPIEIGSKIYHSKIADEVVYIVVDEANLYKSLDKGTSWNRIFIPPYGGVIRSLDVYDKNTLCLHIYKKLYTSFDEGESWTIVPFPRDFRLNEIFMIDSLNIVAGGGYYDSGYKGILFKTQDNGFNFFFRDIQQEANQIFMSTEQIGFALTDYDLYKTINGGISWITKRSANVYNNNYSAFCFKDTLNGLLREKKNFLRTTDGGNNWAEVELNYPVYETTRMIVNSKEDIFAVGNGNLLVYSENNSTENNQSRNDINIETTDENFLHQNYPNPFNPSTKINFSINEAARVRLILYDILGNEIKSLLNEYKQPGNYEVEFDARGLPSGVYYYRLISSKYSTTKKMTLLK